MSKSKMIGMVKNYREMFKDIMNWDTGEAESKYYQHGTHKVLGNERGHYLWDAGYALSDMGFHGWEGEAAKNEKEIYEKIELSYLYLLKSLAEAIGFEYTDEDSVWKYHLKHINTNDILKLKDKNMEKFVKLTTSESGDWKILEVDGVKWASGHSISENDWLGLISEHFDGMIERATISDEEMEARC